MTASTRCRYDHLYDYVAMASQWRRNDKTSILNEKQNLRASYCYNSYVVVSKLLLLLLSRSHVNSLFSTCGVPACILIIEL